MKQDIKEIIKLISIEVFGRNHDIRDFNPFIKPQDTHQMLEHIKKKTAPVQIIGHKNCWAVTIEAGGEQHEGKSEYFGVAASVAVARYLGIVEEA